VLVSVLLLAAFASAGFVSQKTSGPSGTQVTRVVNVDAQNGFIRVTLNRSVKDKSSNKVRGGDRLMFEFRTVPVARVLFQYWKAEKTPGTSDVSTSAVNFRFAFWKVILYTDAANCVVPDAASSCSATNNCCGFDENDQIHGIFVLWGRIIPVSGPSWQPIYYCPNPNNALCAGFTPSTPGNKQLNGTLTNGGFSLILHGGNTDDFKTKGTGERVFNPEEMKLDVIITPANLFPTLWTGSSPNFPNAKVAVQARFVARTREVTYGYGNKSVAISGTKADISIGTSLSGSTYLGLDYTFGYLDNSGVMNVAPDPTVIVSPWFPLNSAQESEDVEKQPGDFPQVFYISFEKNVGSLTKIIWDPAFGLEGGDFGDSAASSTAISGLLLFFALASLLFF